MGKEEGGVGRCDLLILTSDLIACTLLIVWVSVIGVTISRMKYRVLVSGRECEMAGILDSSLDQSAHR